MKLADLSKNKNFYYKAVKKSAYAKFNLFNQRNIIFLLNMKLEFKYPLRVKKKSFNKKLKIKLLQVIKK